ncbi:S-layer family protein, partial [Candidatus Saccharibacteria bacterium]|nr:S-layer family protein [Candidatus Saccharibacteria bacterium]
QVTGTQTGISTGAGYTGQIATGVGLQVSAPTIAGSQLIPDYRGISISGNTANTGNTTGTIENYQIRIGGNTAAAGAGGSLSNYGIYTSLGSGNTAGTNNYGIYINGNGGASATSNYAIYSTSTAASLLSGAFTTSGGIVNLNQSSNYATNINAGTSTSAVTIGNSANTTNLASRTINVGASGATNTIQGITQATATTSGNQLSIIGSTGNGAAGGVLLLQGGSGNGTNQAGGDVNLVGGTPTGAGVVGTVNVQTTVNGNVAIGNAGNAANTVTITAGATNGINLTSSLINLGSSGATVKNGTTLTFQSNTATATDQTIIIKSNATQAGTTDLLELQSSAAAKLGGILATGQFWSAPNITDTSTQLPSTRAFFQANGAGTPAIIVRAPASGSDAATDIAFQAQSRTGTNNLLTVGGNGVTTLLGGQTPASAADLTTASAGTSNTLTIAPGNSTTNSATGSALTLRGSNQTGTTSTGGAVNIQGGSGTTTYGAVNLNVSVNSATNIATGTNTSAVTIGNSANTTTIGSNTIYHGTNNGSIVLTAVAQTGATTGNGLTVRAGAGGTGNQNGGTLTLSGGAASGSGVLGLVNLNPTAFTGTSQNCSTASCSIVVATVDANSTVLVNNTYAGSTVSLADPTIVTAGRVLYVTNSGTQDMTLSVNGGGAGNTIALKMNTTATMFWNGSDWTAAGASSATDLQAAYNNTQSTAGGAEIVLTAAAGNAEGLTIRNNGTTPITGALFEVQSSIAANLFSVNNNTTEYAVNGGVEDSAFNGWSNYNSGTAAKTTTAGTYATGVAGVSVNVGGVAGRGVKNTLSTTMTAGVYVISFSAKITAGTNNFNVWFSSNGTATTATCDAALAGSGYPSNLNFPVTTSWTKVSCFVTVPAGATSSNAILIANASTTNFYVDNLSVISNASSTTPANVQIGGGALGGQPTLFTLDQFAGPPMTTDNPAYYGSMYYDTTKNAIQCYQASTGWGACGSAPDDIITLTPEYTGAVLNGTGVGTLTADFCGNGGGLSVNTSFCASGEARNYYKWTSPQPSAQTYSVYVAYKLPSTFKGFYNGTTSLTGLVDSTSNAGVSYSIYRKASGGGLTSCSASKTVVGSGSGSANTWTTATPTTDPSTCTTFVAGDTVIFQITVSAQSGYAAYAENLTFRYTNK